MDKNWYANGLNSALWQNERDEQVMKKEYQKRLIAGILFGICIGAMLFNAGCLTNSVLKPSARSIGVAVTVAYFETENVPHEDLQNVREAARISYHALKLLTDGETSIDEALIVKAMSELGIDSVGLKLMALEFYRESELKLNLRFPDGLTPEIIEEFKAGVEAGIAAYKPELD